MGLTLLIVDDSAVMRALVKRAIAAADSPFDNVLEAANGRDALALLERQTPDVLVTDINMPVMSGLELIRQIRERGAWKDLICVVMSSDSSEARRVEVRNLGVEVFVGKPFRPEVMRDALCRVHDRAAVR